MVATESGLANGPAAAEGTNRPGGEGTAMTRPAPASGADRSCPLSEPRALVDRVDRAVCEAIAGTATPGSAGCWCACRTPRTTRGCGW